MTPYRKSLLATVLLLAALGCPTPPRVVQGTVVSCDPASTVLVMTDELHPDRQLSLNLAGAEVGAPPAPGDTVRVAYRDENGKLVATRVMNLTRQAEVKSGGH